MINQITIQLTAAKLAKDDLTCAAAIIEPFTESDEGMLQTPSMLFERIYLDESSKPDVLRLVDDAHASAANPFQDPIMRRDDFSDQAGSMLVATFHRVQGRPNRESTSAREPEKVWEPYVENAWTGHYSGRRAT